MGMAIADSRDQFQHNFPKRPRRGDVLSRPSPSGLRKRYGILAANREAKDPLYRLVSPNDTAPRDGEMLSGSEEFSLHLTRKSVLCVVQRGSRVATAARALSRQREGPWRTSLPLAT